MDVIHPHGHVPPFTALPTAGAGRGRPGHDQDGHRWQQRDSTPGVAGREGRNVYFVLRDARRVTVTVSTSRFSERIWIFLNYNLKYELLSVLWEYYVENGDN